MAFAFGMMKERGEFLELQWQKQVDNLPQIARERFEAMVKMDISNISYPQFEVGQSVATRVSNGKILMLFLLGWKALSAGVLI